MRSVQLLIGALLPEEYCGSRDFSQQSVSPFGASPAPQMAPLHSPAFVPNRVTAALSERRLEPRFQPPSCPTCGKRETVVAVTRTRHVLYIRCPRCADVWSVPRPRLQPERA